MVHLADISLRIRQQTQLLVWCIDQGLPKILSQCPFKKIVLAVTLVWQLKKVRLTAKLNHHQIYIMVATYVYTYVHKIAYI